MPPCPWTIGFGSPVVPELYRTNSGWSNGTGSNAGSAASDRSSCQDDADGVIAGDALPEHRRGQDHGGYRVHRREDRGDREETGLHGGQVERVPGRIEDPDEHER